MTTPAEEEIAIRPVEAARRTGVSREAIYAAIRKGTLVAHKPGPRLVLIKVEDLRKWVEGAK